MSRGRPRHSEIRKLAGELHDKAEDIRIVISFCRHLRPERGLEGDDETCRHVWRKAVQATAEAEGIRERLVYDALRRVISPADDLSKGELTLSRIRELTFWLKLNRWFLPYLAKSAKAVEDSVPLIEQLGKGSNDKP